MLTVEEYRAAKVKAICALGALGFRHQVIADLMGNISRYQVSKIIRQEQVMLRSDNGNL